MKEEITTQRIRLLNDSLRCRRSGGKVYLTSGVNGLGPDRVLAIMNAVAGFDQFDGDNDPFGEHDCATLTVCGLRIIWKIDYYDNSMQCASPDPSDPERTSRVLTIMLAEEY